MAIAVETTAEQQAARTIRDARERQQAGETILGASSIGPRYLDLMAEAERHTLRLREVRQRKEAIPARMGPAAEADTQAAALALRKGEKDPHGANVRRLAAEDKSLAREAATLARAREMALSELAGLATTPGLADDLAARRSEEAARVAAALVELGDAFRVLSAVDGAIRWVGSRGQKAPDPRPWSLSISGTGTTVDDVLRALVGLLGD